MHPGSAAPHRARARRATGHDVQAANKDQLEQLESKIKDAEENLGETEVRDAMAAKADYLGKVRFSWGGVAGQTSPSCTMASSSSAHAALSSRVLSSCCARMSAECFMAAHAPGQARRCARRRRRRLATAMPAQQPTRPPRTRRPAAVPRRTCCSARSGTRSTGSSAALDAMQCRCCVGLGLAASPQPRLAPGPQGALHQPRACAHPQPPPSAGWPSCMATGRV